MYLSQILYKAFKGDYPSSLASKPNLYFLWFKRTENLRAFLCAGFAQTKFQVPVSLYGNRHALYGS